MKFVEIPLCCNVLNVCADEIKMEAEKLTSSLREAIGNVEFNNLYANINDFYHKKRNENRANKKEKVWNFVYYSFWYLF